MIKMLVLALPLAMLAAPAGAQALGSAALVAPTGIVDPMIVNGGVWRCSGATCAGPAGGDRFGDERTCKELAQKVGAVAAFTSRRGALAVDDLAKCNVRARRAG